MAGGMRRSSWMRRSSSSGCSVTQRPPNKTIVVNQQSSKPLPNSSRTQALAWDVQLLRQAPGHLHLFSRNVHIRLGYAAQRRQFEGASFKAGVTSLAKRSRGQAGTAMRVTGDTARPAQFGALATLHAQHCTLPSTAPSTHCSTADMSPDHQEHSNLAGHSSTTLTLAAVCRVAAQPPPDAAARPSGATGL